MLLHLLIQLRNNIPGALTLLFRCWCFVFPNDQNIKKTFTPNPNVGNIPLHCHLCLVKSNENSLPFAVNNFNSCSKFGHVVSAAKQIWYDPIGVLSLQDASWGLSPAATYIQNTLPEMLTHYTQAYSLLSPSHFYTCIPVLLLFSKVSFITGWILPYMPNHVSTSSEATGCG